MCCRRCGGRLRGRVRVVRQKKKLVLGPSGPRGGLHEEVGRDKGREWDEKRRRDCKEAPDDWVSSQGREKWRPWGGEESRALHSTDQRKQARSRGESWSGGTLSRHAGALGDEVLVEGLEGLRARVAAVGNRLSPLYVGSVGPEQGEDALPAHARIHVRATGHELTDE
jgi:hypothetical protein